MAVVSNKLTAVFQETASPRINQVNRVKITIPQANVTNRPGHTAPLVAVATHLTPTIIR